jgi:hypothetical protein
MLERALQLREALMLLVGMEQHNKPRGARLNRFKLSKQEWDLLSQLFPLLDVSIMPYYADYVELDATYLNVRYFSAQQREFQQIIHRYFTK